MMFNLKSCNHFTKSICICCLTMAIGVFAAGESGAKQQVKKDAIKKHIQKWHQVLKPILTTDAQIFQLLETHRISIEWIDMTLSEAITELRTKFHTNIMPYWPAMMLAGIDRDETITLRLKNVPCGVILGILLEYVSIGKQEPLGYVVDQGVIEVSSKSRLEKRFRMKVYYIADLLAKRSDLFNNILGQNGHQGSGQSGQSTSGSRQTKSSGSK